MLKLILLIFLPIFLNSQVNYVSNNIFQTDYFIENRGQFNHELKDKKLILFNTEMPFGDVFFHKNGFYIKQVKIEPRNEHENENNRQEKKDKKPEIDIIHLEWLNSNPNCEIISSDKSNHYFSYGSDGYKSYGYRKLTYKNIYPNIDIVYSITDNHRFHYSIILHKGGKISDIKMSYIGCKTDLINNDKILELSKIICPFYEFGLEARILENKDDSIACSYSLENNILTFNLGIESIDKDIVIDPWISTLTSLTGDTFSAQRGYDVDYDNIGNLLVYGGGGKGFINTERPKIAKYNFNGVLLWTYLCSSGLLKWNTSSSSMSNFIVDKFSNKIYIGDGYESPGSRALRIDTSGIYDNFISVINPKYRETWDFQFNCYTGDIIALGGGTNSNLNVGIINKTNGSNALANVTNLIGDCQDIVSSAIDNNGSVYVILATGGGCGPSFMHNRIYKLNPALNGFVWNKFSGYYSFYEAGNKPFASSNGFNALSANNQYLFYYDGVNLKTFNISNGDTVGFPLSLSSHSLKYQGGIESDNCNNVYIGGNNGNVLVYNFNGLNFNFIGQFTISGQIGKSIYDLKVNKKNNKLYISGDGFVAETNFSTCDSSFIKINLISNCKDTATVTISNYLVGTVFDFIWTDTASNTIIRTKLNTSQIKDTFVGIYGKTYKLAINSNSICLPETVKKYLSFKTDTTVYNQNIVRCISYKIGNHTYNQSGVYKDTIIEFGCSKIIQTFLTILPISIDTIRKTLCNSDIIIIRGVSISKSGTYYDTLINKNGCDSVLVYIIIASSLSSNNTLVFDTICSNKNKFFNNQNLNLTGIYKDTFINQYGCDSIVTLFLFVKSNINKIITATICSDQTYYFKNKNISISGTYLDTLIATIGCDTFVTLNLIIDLKISTVINSTICQNQSYYFKNKNIAVSGTYFDTLKSVKGCDSFVTLNLSVIPILYTTINKSICQGQNFQVGLNYYSKSGTYTISLKTVNNCDSIVTLNLKVNPTFLYFTNVIICKGKFYNFYGVSYFNSGIYQHRLKTINGCDSIYELRLTVTEILGIQSFEICHGDSIWVGKKFVKSEGDYYDTIRLSNGCDSFHLYRVKIIPLTASFSDTVLCSNDSFKYKGVIYFNSTTIQDTIRDTFKSCDKLVFIHLKFINCDTLNECNRILIPSGFSPNNDGINDYFSPIIKSDKINVLEFIVYNRWGQIVYSFHDNQKGWDGKNSNIYSPTGIYIYKIKYKCKGLVYSKTDNVTLIR